jgi:hypothetical protein
VYGRAVAGDDHQGVQLTPVVRRHLVLAVLVVLACGLAMVNSYPWSGPVLLTLTATHGVHETDPLVLALAGSCVTLLALSARRLSAAARVPSAAYVLAA